MNRDKTLHKKGHYRSLRTLTYGFTLQTATNIGFVTNRYSFKTVTHSKHLTSLFRYCQSVTWAILCCCSTELHDQNIHHHHKHQGLDPLIRSVSRVKAARANASLVFQLFSFLVVCNGMISMGFRFVAFYASVKASTVYIHLSCLVCL